MSMSWCRGRGYAQAGIAALGMTLVLAFTSVAQAQTINITESVFVGVDNGTSVFVIPSNISEVSVQNFSACGAGTRPAVLEFNLSALSQIPIGSTITGAQLMCRTCAVNGSVTIAIHAY